ncbi:hypothetical protein RCL1_006123 [Eukaryota sp. TZLM3-RCL]
MSNPFDILPIDEPEVVVVQKSSRPIASDVDAAYSNTKDSRAKTKGPSKRHDLPPTQGTGKRAPKREFDRHSGTGRSYELKRQGGGAFNVGTDADLVQEAEILDNVAPVPSPDIIEEEIVQEAPKQRTLSDYLSEMDGAVIEASGRQKTSTEKFGETIYSPEQHEEEENEEEEQKSNKKKGYQDITAEMSQWWRSSRGGFDRSRGGRGGRGQDRERRQQQ